MCMGRQDGAVNNERGIQVKRMSIWLPYSAIAVILLIAIPMASGQVEEGTPVFDVPIFPTVLIILDTSGSMAETPYRTLGGDPVLVGTKAWKREVKTDSSGNPVYDSSGSPEWTDVDRSKEDPFAEGVDPDVYLTGGNHPASKLYKAKLALNKVLPEVDTVNLGFATFLQERVPRVKALYYRKVKNQASAEYREYYEFAWFTTLGQWMNQSKGTQYYIDPATLQVVPHSSCPYNSGDILDDELALPGDIPPDASEAEIQCSPIPLKPGTFPAPPKTPNFSGSPNGWSLVPQKGFTEVSLADGTRVNVSRCCFDYALVRYPNTLVTPDDYHPHTWSYTHQRPTLGSIASSCYNRQWEWAVQHDPYYPADGLSNDYLGDPNERGNYYGDDHIFFVHLPDPSFDDNAEAARKNRKKILSFISLERETDPTFDCHVAPVNESDTSCDFCPHGTKKDTDGMRKVFRQFTCMPFTDSIACGGWTPLGQVLGSARKYYLSYFAQGTKYQQQCRENCVILLTDGRSNCRDNSSKDPDDPVQAAADLLNLALKENGECIEVPVKTYVIGFGLDAESRSLCNAIAVAGGTSKAYFATSMEAAVSALGKILGRGPQGHYTRSDPVIVGTDALYTGFFQLPSWKGHLKKYSLVEEWWRQDPKEWYTEDVRWYGGGSKDETGLLLDGDAGARLSTQRDTSRVIYTADHARSGENKRVEFTEGNAGDDGDLVKAGLVTTGFQSAAEMVSFIRDIGYGQKANGNVSWKLGDIYHSTPVVVREPLHKELREDDRVLKRTPVVLVGANDGMVHAFDDADGKELWGYIPQCVLEKLHTLADGHEFFIDLDIKAADVMFNGDWRTVLMGGLRQGGRHYFALDITHTDDPLPLWEVTHAAMGQTWSTPSFGRIPVGGLDRYVAFVAGGYDPDADAEAGNAFYIIDSATGEFLHEFTKIGDDDEDFPAQVRAVDLDNDGFIERVYFVSTKGKLFRLHIDPEQGVDSKPTMIFDPGSYDYGKKEMIKGIAEAVPVTRIVSSDVTFDGNVSISQRSSFYAPAVMRTEYLPHNYLIHYGTGDDLNVLDEDSQDFFFEIEDCDAESKGLVESRCNWVYIFEPGEKCLSRPVTFDYIVYFTTYNPYQCGRGEGYVYGITTSSRLGVRGDPALSYDLDRNPSGKKCYRAGGISGIPSSPLVNNGSVIGNSSQDPTGLWKLKINEVPDRIRSWQELF